MTKVEDIFAFGGGIIRAVIFLFMVALLIPFALLYKRIDPQHPFRLPQHFHRGLLALLGIRLRVIGAPSTASPVLFVANHASYLDIPVLGALLPAAFVAKSEVAHWPLFGLLSRIQNTIFIERRSVRAASQRAQLRDHFVRRQNLILFPEGTSSDGLTALPFKSTLFAAVEDSAQGMDITVQPVSVTCIACRDRPLRGRERDLYAWYGDMTMPPHLWNVFKRASFTVEVIFHPPLTTRDHPDRKLLAAACQEQVARGIERSLASL